jgi:hypothetical protein
VKRAVWRDFVPPRILFSIYVGGFAADIDGKKMMWGRLHLPHTPFILCNNKEIKGIGSRA